MSEPVTSAVHGVLPPELLRSAPRPVVLRGAGKAVLVVAIALLLGGIVGGVIFYAVAARDAARNERLAGENVAAPGEVVELGRTRGDHPRRVVVYRYLVEGREYHGRAVLRAGDRHVFATGTPVEVRYARSQPDVSWMPGYEPRGIPVLLPAVVGLALALLAALLLWRIRREQELLAEGRPATARVTSSKKRSEHGKSSYFRVEYEFTILSGATRTGYADVGKSAPAAGSTVTILYDRERPEKSVLYPLPLVRVDVPQS